ncbi:MAG: hypothetical protein IH926_04430 [Proteobacteria bacterium]|nr:hypothetical protein [Pseudomonadota bacterium]
MAFALIGVLYAPLLVVQQVTAARLLSAHPDWRAPELRAAIFARARKTAATAGIVSQGLIINPSLP